ncbi:MAG: nitroreductase family protein [Coriobacteriales bacterium]|jgi:nitroreductase|nr:nitroreductase family protein [Coriobacteriales bacterium]
MPIAEIISKRRSVRNYKEGAIVTDEQVRSLLEAAMLAPSACNQRPWEFLVVRDPENLSAICEFHPYTSMLKTASLAIIVLIDTNAHNAISEPFNPQDAGAATQNILLQAVHEGLGTCWCGIYPEGNLMNYVRELFGLPENLAPFNVIAVGVANEDGGSRGFYEEEKVHWDKL